MIHVLFLGNCRPTQRLLMVVRHQRTLALEQMPTYLQHQVQTISCGWFSVVDVKFFVWLLQWLGDEILPLLCFFNTGSYAVLRHDDSCSRSSIMGRMC